MKRLAIATLITLAAGAAALPATSAFAAPNVNLYVGVAPPAPIVERVPAPRHGYVWAPGHWEWNGRRHVWVGGYWIAERPGYVYSAPVWVQRGGGWVMEPERWAPRVAYERVVDVPRHGPGYYHDRDRDGIPDRFEHRGRRDEDRDGVPNRYDHDRDGDGVPNRYDRRPDNPYRR